MMHKDGRHSSHSRERYRHHASRHWYVLHMIACDDLELIYTVFELSLSILFSCILVLWTGVSARLMCELYLDLAD